MAKGSLKVQCFRGDNYYPVDKVKVTITPTGEEVSPKARAVDVYTDTSGLTQKVELDAPSFDNSQNPGTIPYSLVDLNVERVGFQPVSIRGVQIYPDRVALQELNLEIQAEVRQSIKSINIPPNVQVGNYPPKIPEDPNKPLPPPTSGVVLEQPVVPEFIIVHQGSPNDPSAPNYTVRFKDYIKNVASSEIYSTWSDSTIRANIYCILSFTLNRIYTEWYTGKGKNYNITSSTAFDHAFTYGRNIYENISAVVDEIFSTYIRKLGKKQPLLTQYCDGKKVQCPGWLTQWGSKYLGDQGRTPIQILTNFYGSDIELVTADKVSGIPKSYPGYTLTIGSKGIPVRNVQTYLNAISKAYPLIPKLIPDGAYGPKTSNSVKVFQSIFTLPQTGDVDYATWYKISDIYVGVTKIAELRSYARGVERVFLPPGVSDDMYNTPYVFYYDDI